MIHTYYSNSYEALRALLIHELSSDAAGLEANEENLTRFFEAVPVIVPSRGVEADLRMAIADAFSVCSGYRFMFLSEWLGFFSKAPLANVIGNEADWILWDILRETGPGSFREEMRAKGCGRLAHYLEGKNDKEILSFARHVSQVFVVYASYRADWVMRWLGIHPELLGEEPAAERRALESHPDFLWQRELWKRLAAHPQQRSRTFFAELPESLEVLARSRGKRLIRLDEHRTVRLPDALHVFVPFVVPPLMLPVVKAYAQSGRDVYLYLLNPSSEYWFDLVPRRLFDWRGSGADEHREVRHPILADNARSTRANIDRLWRFTSGSLRAEEPLQLSEALEASAESPVPTHERTFDDFNRFESDPHRIAAEWLARPKDLEAGVETEEASFYLEAHDPRLLRRVQDSILNLDPDLAAAAERDALPLFSEEDGSLVFAAAPTPTRELEGLVDWLHAQFEKYPDLKPDEVLVATPDISAAAPLIEKVFGSLPEGRRIAWKVTGVRALDTDPASQALAGLAALLQGRVHRDELLAWLSMPIVAAKFGFTGEDLGILGDWLRSAGFRFGLSDGHLETLEGETYRRVREMSLERALERLAFGFATEGEATFGDVAPVAGNESGGWTTSAERPDLLSKLGVAAARLEELRIRAAEAGEALPAVWLEWTNDVIAECFPPESADYAYDALRSAVGDLVGELEEASVGSAEPIRVAFPLFMQALTERLGGSASSGTPTNAVTFAGMSELRGIPRRIIVVFGLNEDSNFPGSSRAEEFDLMQAAPRRGDRDSRHDNRNVFLDLMLAARDAFLVSYVCGTEADEKDPSIVAKELRDWLLGFAHGKAARREAAKILSIEQLLNRKPKALSGGQRQRVALGRAIVRDPKVFLMDEPLSNLDAKLRVQMRTEITKLHQRLQTTFIYVTHDQTEAMTMGNRIVVMKDGFIQQVDTPQNLYDYPGNLFVGSFIGSPQMNFFDAKLVKKADGVWAEFGDNAIKVPDAKIRKLVDESYIGKEVIMGIRPENIHDEERFVSVADGNLVEAKVEVVELMGSETYLYLKTTGKDSNVIARVDPRSASRTGNTVKVAFETNRLHFFDKDSELSILNR